MTKEDCMGAPIINISFIEKAKTIFGRAERGVVGLIQEVIRKSSQCS